MKYLVFFIFFLVFNSCSQLPFGQSDNLDDLKQAATEKIFEPQINNFILKNARGF